MTISNEASDFLDRANIAIMATIGPGNRPHAAPVWYLYEDGVFIMSTGRGSQKHRNVEAQPEITLVVDRRSLPYYAVMAQGRAEIGPRLADEERRRMATRYLGEKLARAYLERVSGEDSVTIRLRPRKLIEFNGRAGRAESG